VVSVLIVLTKQEALIKPGVLAYTPENLKNNKILFIREINNENK